MLFWPFRWFTKSVSFSKVNFSICVGGAVAGTPAKSSVITLLKTLSAIAILGSSSGSFDFEEPFLLECRYFLQIQIVLGCLSEESLIK